MTKAMQVYIRTIKIYGMDITYKTSDGYIRGAIELPDGQFNIDKFASTLEFYDNSQSDESQTKDGGVPIVKLIDGTGCTVDKMFPTSGRDMLLKLSLLIPPMQIKEPIYEHLKNIISVLNIIVDRLQKVQR